MTVNRPENLARYVRRQIVGALLIAVVFIVGMGVWSVAAPLASAALAPGVIGIETRRQTVQHLEGGIVAQLFVRDGDRVEQGASLLRMDATVARSTYDLLEGQFIDLKTEEARLMAEQGGAGTVPKPDLSGGVLNRARADAALNAQRALFDSRRSAMESRVQILLQRIRKLAAQIDGLDKQEASTLQQFEIILREEGIVGKMVRQGLEREPRLLALQRARADLDGVLGEINAKRAQAEIRIGETELEIVDLKANTLNQVTGDLRRIVGQIADMEPRLRAARDTLSRIDIRAPVTGTVVGLRHHTVGGVLRPGEPIMDIVPADARFLVQARISPADIDVVRPGLPAEVRLSALSARTTPTLPGQVVHVSADVLNDPNARVSYYEAHIRLMPGAEDSDTPDLSVLYPGMPVEVMVITGRRTMVEYLTQPITDLFARAFRES